MPLQLYLAFLATATLLIVTPGPNVALIVANSVAHGTRFGLLTVAGTSCAMVLQLALTCLSLHELLTNLAYALEWLRWIGVAYLLYLAIKHWFAKPTDPAVAQSKSARNIFLRGFLVSLTNPKTLLFYGTFFPLFLSPTATGHSPMHQLLLLSFTFLALAILLDSSWALAAGGARHVLQKHTRWRNRLTATLLAGAAVGLAFARKK